MDFEKLKSIMVIMTMTTTTTTMMMMMMIVSPLHALFLCRAEAEEVSHSETSSPDPVKREQKRRHRGSYCMMVPFMLFWFYTHTTLQDDTHSVCFFFRH